MPIGNDRRIGGAASIVEPGTGKVLAMAQASQFPKNGEKGKKFTQVNWNVDRRYGGTTGFQFGSTAKMYAIVTALQNGIPVNGKVPSKFATDKQAAVYTPSEMTRQVRRRSSSWPVRNDEAIGGKPLPSTSPRRGRSTPPSPPSSSSWAPTRCRRPCRRWACTRATATRSSATRRR